jgi:uncharacterized protein YecE (DUF72 family)
MDELDFTVPQQFRPHLRVGTCSWKYDSWKGLVYEPGRAYAPDDYLADYARLFSTVEVDQWFWSLFPAGVKLPEPATARACAESVPGNFVFTVKAPNALTLTHYYARQSKRYAEFANRPNEHFLSAELLERFLETIEPMRPKLGPIMFQFEYLNKKKMASKGAFFERLHEFFTRAPKGYRYAIETRNPNYLSSEFFDFLRDHSLGYVFIEGYYMPPIAQVFDAHDTGTADFAVVRLHGGGREEIEQATGKDWSRLIDPHPEGIEAAVKIIRSNMGRGAQTYINANNHFEGSAPLTLARLIEELRRP